MASEGRIRERLAKLSSFTSVPGKITRQTYSKPWEQAVCWLSELMKQMDMETRIDGFGNLVGIYNPDRLYTEPAGIGSHIDTVVNGGAYDGAIGIIAGLEVVDMLREQRKKLPYPIEVIAFAEEEGGVFGRGCMGSEYITAHTPLEKLSQYKNRDGRTSEELAAQASLQKAVFGSDYGWGRCHFLAFCEIHAEQGPFLQEAGKQIGIVDGVVGILRFKVTFKGQPNHAGTTRMARRKDAMAALAEFILQSYRYGLEHDGYIVITNGKIGVSPNLHNVIPGTAWSVTELRAENNEEIQAGQRFLQAEAQKIAKRSHMNVEFSAPVYVCPAAFDKELLRLQDDLIGRNETVSHLFSWAGHDAKLMSAVTPSMMLFVPSRGGMSHCPEEFSNVKDIAAATDILLELLRRVK